MKPNELLEDLKNEFPMCFLTIKGYKIKVHLESMVDGMRAYSFTDFKFPYKLGVHYRLANYLESKGYFTELKNEELFIKKA